MVGAEHFLFILALLSLVASSCTDSVMVSSAAGVATNNASDYLALLSFKSLIRTDQLHALESWGNSSIPLCQWRGVVCGRRGRRHGRVTALHLENLSLVGSISSSVANLTFLRKLHLPSNHLQGLIPRELAALSYLQSVVLSKNMLEGKIPHELGSLQNLKVLNVSYNKLTGSIPRELSNLVKLEVLNIGQNHLTGEIPTEIGKLVKLRSLSLWANQLGGSIPTSLGSLSALSFLDLDTNNLTGGIPPLQNLSSLTVLELSSNDLSGCIPSQLGNLTSLVFISLKYNRLTGIIPESLGNLILLQILGLEFNNLTGSIPNSIGNLLFLKEIGLENNGLEGPLPPSFFNLSYLEMFNALENYYLSGSFPQDMGNLPNLQVFLIDYNQFHGPIPPIFCNSSMLQMFEAAHNLLTGTIPNCLGIHLSSLVLGYNQIQATRDADWGFMDRLANCSDLQILDLSFNMFEGEIPSSVGNLSTNVERINMKSNNLTGKIPEEITNLVNLKALSLAKNYLEGVIPNSVGKLKGLGAFALEENYLSGSIPRTVGNLTKLNILYLDDNMLNGSIPSSLSSCPLQDLNLSHNRLTGPIPKELFLVSTLSNFLILDHNLLTGPLPPEVGNLRNVEGLDLSSNNISGEIPPSIGNCQSLEYLSISGNFLQGVIPSSLGQLNGLLELDLSHNNLSGRIPNFLGNMRGLTNLNLSFNNFEGEVPKDGIFLNVTAISILGNNGLCGGISQLNLPLCSSHPSNTHSQKKIMVISIVAGVLFLTAVVVLFAIIHWRSKTRREAKHESLLTEQHMRVSYAELVNATNDFSSENLVGVGSFGSVYKGRMTNNDQQLVIAVKVFNLQTRGALKSFDAECETLRYVRHRNLLKVLTVCSSTDFRGDDFKALIYEFLPNGNLHEWLHLHPEMEGEKKVLDLVQRISIAIDVASAIDYLHHHNPFPIIHCDLKPTNVLLDNNMVAQVGDFGLARFLHEDSSDILEQSTGWAAMRGTIGYAAPEYGQGNNASIQGDVYSFGILLLEMFTGKRPTDSEVAEGCNLHKYVEMALQDQAINVIDQHLLSVTEDDEGRTRGNQQTIREKRIACIVSALEIGFSCSRDLPADRMQIRDALKELLVARKKLIHGS